jgi:hypothetical protein
MTFATIPGRSSVSFRQFSRDGACFKKLSNAVRSRCDGLVARWIMARDTITRLYFQEQYGRKLAGQSRSRHPTFLLSI